MKSCFFNRCVRVRHRPKRSSTTHTHSPSIFIVIFKIIIFTYVFFKERTDFDLTLICKLCFFSPVLVAFGSQTFCDVCGSVHANNLNEIGFQPFEKPISSIWIQSEKRAACDPSTKRWFERAKTYQEEKERDGSVDKGEQMRKRVRKKKSGSKGKKDENEDERSRMLRFTKWCLMRRFALVCARDLIKLRRSKADPFGFWG